LDDVPAGLALGRASRWNQTEGDWRTLLEPPSVFRAAEREGRVVGTAGAVGYGTELAWVCMVLVDPAVRGQGIGTRLVAEVLERLTGFAVVGLDATPQGRPVYSQLGFTDGPGLVRLETPADRRTAPGPKTPARPLRENDLPRILGWDREVFGADRSRVLRFALRSAPEYAWVLDDGAGYCFGRHGHNAEQIGPVVTRTPEGARALVATVLAHQEGRRFFVDATAPGQTAISDLGFREQRPFTRMYRGLPRPAAEATALYAVFGPEFG